MIGSYLRRLVGKDVEWQELLGTDELDTPMFLALGQNQAAKLAGLPIPGGKIETVRVHLTGPRVSDDTLSIRKYYVSDKHELEHSCYNAMLNPAFPKYRRYSVRREGDSAIRIMKL